MAEILNLERFRIKIAADQGFRSWLARFKEQFGPETRLTDLSDKTLLYLATPGEENLYVFFDLVMGSQGMGGSLRFRLDDLDSGAKLKIMDTALALMDLARFELMRRLGWVEVTPETDLPLIDLVRQAWRQDGKWKPSTPRMSSSHREYPQYTRLNLLDQAVCLRRLIPQAVATFRERVERES